MKRHQIISAFVNLTAGTKLYRPGSDDPIVLGLRERVTPPGKFESHDAEQIARLIRARCLKSADTAVQAPPATDGGGTDNSVSPPVSGEAVLHAFQNPDAPSPIPATEARDPRVDGGPSDPAGGSSAAGTGPGPIAGAIPGAGAALVTVGDGESPPAGTGVSPPVTGIAAIAPPAPLAAPAPPPAKPAPARKGGAGSPTVAGKDGGGRGDGTVSNRDRRRIAREAAAKRD